MSGQPAAEDDGPPLTELESLQVKVLKPIFIMLLFLSSIVTFEFLVTFYFGAPIKESTYLCSTVVFIRIITYLLEVLFFIPIIFVSEFKLCSNF